jgi:mono/diheme cytochrome c family protein
MHLGLALTLVLVSSAQRRFVGAHARAAAQVSAAVVASVGLGQHAAGAADLANGQLLFTQKCAACHEGGAGPFGNDLKTPALERNGYSQLDGMLGLLNKGKGMMPAFGPTAPPFARFNDAQLTDVAEYVLAQAATGWAK